MDPIYPLTTIYTPPASCSKRLFTLTDPDRTSWLSWDADLESIATLTCYPSEWVSAAPVPEFATFSPGVCPSDYTMFSTRTTGAATIAFCCPSGFTGLPSYQAPPDCSRSITAPTTALYYALNTEDYRSTIAGTTTVDHPQWAVAYGYRVEWQSSDLPRFTPKSAPLLQLSAMIPISETSETLLWAKTTLPTTATVGHGSSSLTSSNAIRTVNGATATGQANSGSAAGSKLSRSQLIGAEVGAIVGFLLLLGAGSWLFLRHRLQGRKRSTQYRTDLVGFTPADHSITLQDISLEALLILLIPVIPKMEDSSVWSGKRARTFL
ncbi:MAG: hypothetical protein M1813_008594 [Trichoglossum hirsutum]|nr:MAG: hypothetical protein M1813_008594 [Trichoglossum hirsutum]